MRMNQTALSPDLGKPSKPTLTATATSSKQIELTWTSAPDNEGVVVYLIERKDTTARRPAFIQIAQTAAPSYSDKRGIYSATTYQYRIRAMNFAGKLSPYSSTVSIKTRPRQPELKEYWTKVNADLETSPKVVEWIALSSLDSGATWQKESLPTLRDRNKQYDIRPSAYVNALCQLKAIEATLNASNSKNWPTATGWNAGNQFATAGYIAARYALLRFDSSKAKLEDFLFYEALAAIKEVAKEEADSWGGKQPHKKDIRTPAVSNFSDVESDAPESRNNPVTTTLAQQSGDWVEVVDNDIDAIRILTTLGPQDRELLTLRVMHDWTYAAIGEKFGFSEDTARRRIERVLEGLKNDFA